MIGWAVQERCPYCKVELDIIATPPGVTVFHYRQCTSRQCRKARRGRLLFSIRDGAAHALTAEEQRAIVKSQRGQTAKSLAS